MPTLTSRLRVGAEARTEAAGAAALRSTLAQIDGLEAAGSTEVDDAQVGRLLAEAAGRLRDAATVCLHTGEDDRAAQLVAEAEALEAYLPRLADRSEIEGVVEMVVDMLTADGGGASSLDPASVTGMTTWILADRLDKDVLEEIVRAKLG